MRFLTSEEREVTEVFLDEAKSVAKQATCGRARCGAVLVGRGGRIIGRGYNSPPGNLESQRRCTCEKSEYDPKVTDKTCCMHAEQRAIMDALKHHPDLIAGSVMYFARFYPDGMQRFLGGDIRLYCTICAKMMFDVGVAEFVLFHQNGICVYSMSEAVDQAFQYHPVK